MKKITLWVALLFSLATALWADDKGVIPIYQQTTIGASGKYLVTQDIAISSGVLLGIAANDVSVNLNGHTLTVTDTISSYVVWSSGFSNIEISNGFISGGYEGILLISNGDFHVENLSISGFSYAGIVLGGTNPSSLSRIVVSNNNVTGPGGVLTSFGIYTEDVENGRIENNQVSKCSIGIYLKNALNSLVAYNTSSTNSAMGIQLNGSTSCKILGNSVSGNGTGLDGAGIYLSNSNKNEMSDNTACGNTTGLFLSDSDFNSLHTNTASANTSYGIFLLDNCDSNGLLENTTACAGGTTGIYIQGIGNIYRDNLTPGACGITDAGTGTVDGGGNI